MEPSSPPSAPARTTSRQRTSAPVRRRALQFVVGLLILPAVASGSAATDAFVARATQKYGDLGRRAALFLVDNMPAKDKTALSTEYLMENLSLALKARKQFPWARQLSDAMFFNDVLPYACVDERRDAWRARFYAFCPEIVRGCKTAVEAAEKLNRTIFNRLDVHYNRARRRANQNASESIAQHMATCTGLSIILVDACRSVGIPARLAGVPQWANGRGNHTWVEIWDGRWQFTGGDEPTKHHGLNHGWFVAKAARTARSPNPMNQVYATSWKRTGQTFPCAWDLADHSVAGVNVSARYAALAPANLAVAPQVQVRLWDRRGGHRLVATVRMYSAGHRVLATEVTRAGRADLNDMPTFTLPAGATQVWFRFTRDGRTRQAHVECAACASGHTLDYVWSRLQPVSAPFRP